MSNRHPEGASIGRYRRVPVEVHRADPAAPEVARRLIALIATRWPGTRPSTWAARQCLVTATGERYSPAVAALLLGARAVGALAVGVIALHRRGP